MNILVDLVLVNMGYALVFLVKFGWNIPQKNIVPYLTTKPWLTSGKNAFHWQSESFDYC